MMTMRKTTLFQVLSISVSCYTPVAKPVGNADTKLLPAGKLFGVVNERIGVTRLAFAYNIKTADR